MIDRLAVERTPPLSASADLPRAVQIAGGGLVGFGVILFIAANWAGLGTFGQFALLGSVYGLAALTAALYPPLRVPGLLVAFAATGALLALVGITYQTGADPWQLFAAWAGLSLPLVLAARHDVTWSAWTLVVSTALPLWLFAATGRAWGGAAAGPTLVTWLLAGGLAALLSPWSGLARWTGSTRWAFRLAACLFLILVTTRALLALWSKDSTGLFLLGLLIVAAVIAALLVVKPFDGALLAIAALAADVLLISALWRMFSGARVSDIGAFLVLGILSAGIVIATVQALRTVTDGRTLDDLMPPAMRNRIGNVMPTDMPRWPTILLSALGAIMAAIPLQIFYWLAFGKVLLSGGGGFVLGPLTIAAGAFAARRGKPFGVGQMIGLILILTGVGVFAWALVQNLPLKAAMVVLTLVAVAGAVVIPVRWLAVLFGFAAASTTAVFFLPEWSVLVKADLLAVRLRITLSVLLIGAIGAAAVGFTAKLNSVDDNDEQRGRMHAFATGWLVSVLLATIAVAGPTFLLGATWSTNAVSTLTPLAEGFAPQMARVGAVLIAALALGGGNLVRGGAASVTALIAAIAAIAFSYFVQPFAVAVAGFVAFRAIGQRAGAAFAVFVGLWCLGSWYYSLGMTLDTKAAILVASGLLLTVVATFDGARLPAGFNVGAATMPSDGTGWSMSTAAGLIATGVVLTALSVTTSVTRNEAIRRDGRLVHIALAPVDPRSLMQGDFMTLAFVLPSIGRAEQAATRLQAIAGVDGRSVATVTRIGRAPLKPQSGEIVIDLTHKGRWTIATDAYFFPEGQGKKFEAARFGTFRITPDGRVSLIGLADKDLRAMK